MAKEAPNRPVSFVADTMYGRWISLRFFTRNAWLWILLLVAIIGLMGLRYKTMTRMARIVELRKELERAESSMLQEKAEYMSLIREGEMQRMARERGLGLTSRPQPPYVIDDEPM